MKGTWQAPFELRPRFSLSNEGNWMLCASQLRAAGLDTLKFSNRYGYHNQQGTRDGRAIESAAEDCGFTVHWTN